MTGPAIKDQVGTKYTESQNHKYLKFCVQYLLSSSFPLLPIKWFNGDKNLTSMATNEHWL